MIKRNRAMIIIKQNKGLTLEEYKKFKEQLEKTKEEYMIIPPNMEVIETNTLHYEVWTKDKYISYLCCNGSDLNNSIKVWNEVSKGYNFVIAIKSNDESIGYMVYSVGYFNDYIVGNKIKDGSI